MSSKILIIIFLACGLLCVSRAESDDRGKRVALVIGNGDYQYTAIIPKLKNPINDTEDISKELRRFGFEVIERKNQTKEAMDTTITEFGRKLDNSEAALFYFSGHGVQVNGQNYLIPIDAKIESEAQVPYKTVNVNQVLNEFDSAKSLFNLVILDACRNNPITGKFRSTKVTGLAAPTSTPQGTVVVYATAPGDVSFDGDERNGLFTAGLLTAFKGTDLSLDGVLTVASEQVENISKKQYGKLQVPYVNGPKTIQKNFKFLHTAIDKQRQVEGDFWISIHDSKDSTDFEAYLKQYPQGSFESLAKNRLRRLQAAQSNQINVNSPITSNLEEDVRSVVNTHFPNYYPTWWQWIILFIIIMSSGFFIKIIKIRIPNYQRKNLQITEHDEPLQLDKKIDKHQFNQSHPLDDKIAKCSSHNPPPLENNRDIKERTFAGIVFMWIPSGCFKMGSPESEKHHQSDESPIHEVCLDGFWMGKYPVTQKQWEKIMGSNPSKFNKGDDYPVENISWEDAQAYIQKLNTLDSGYFRLPTESEWEYAARAGTTTPFYFGHTISADTQANYNGNEPYENIPLGQYRQETTPVGSFPANAFGLHDMHGNIWEWVDDWYYEKFYDSVNATNKNPQCKYSINNLRVLRGGSWYSSAWSVRSAVRLKSMPDFRNNDYGFRLVRLA